MERDDMENAASYDRIADEWERVRDASPVNACVVSLEKRLKKNASILDAGCGTGAPISFWLSSRGHRVTGIDISERMLRKARARELGNAEFLRCGFLEYKSVEPYDALIAFDSLFHIPPGRQRDIYPHAAELLKDGGYFLFTHGKKESRIEGEMFGTPFFYAALDAAEVRRLLEENGFEILEMTEDYAEETTGSRDLFVLARKKLQRN